MLRSPVRSEIGPVGEGLQFSSVGPAVEHATIGASVVIKGKVSGAEDLFIDGTVEGTIDFPSHRVTVGRAGRVTADITARNVVIMGSVKGNIYCADLLDIRGESSIRGDIVTRRIRIDDGAVLKGSVEIEPSRRSPEKGNPDTVQAAVAEPVKEAKAETAATTVATAPTARRLSSTLLESVR